MEIERKRQEKCKRTYSWEKTERSTTWLFEFPVTHFSMDIPAKFVGSKISEYDWTLFFDWDFIFQPATNQN